MIATDLMQALHAHSGCRMALLSPLLTCALRQHHARHLIAHVLAHILIPHPRLSRPRLHPPPSTLSPERVELLCAPPCSFHYVQGDSVVKHPQNQRARNDRIFTGLYTAWNCAQFARNRRDILKRYPEYEQCWFNHQAEWSVYTYQCAMTIDHLPHEFKLLWHNGSALDAPATSRSNCNLPTICHQCRKDGIRRQAVDLMSPTPCGFCRCATDLPTPG